MAEFTGLTAPLYERLIDTDAHVLIAGCSGSGKSTLLNSMLEVISLRPVSKHSTILIDVKMVELGQFENTKHCLRCATSVEDAEDTLDNVMNIISTRLAIMKDEGSRIWNGTKIHLVVDELADLILTSKRAVTLLQRICQLGRAAGIQVICATQCPLASVIPTRIKVNFPVLIGLRTATAQHSRNIVEVNGCEKLPKVGKALIRWPGEDVQKIIVPKIPDEVITQAIETDLRS